MHAKRNKHTLSKMKKKNYCHLIKTQFCQLNNSNKTFKTKDLINDDLHLLRVEYVQLYLPFFGGVFVEGVKNFVTVWTLLDFSLVFLSSNLLKRVMFDCGWAF